MALFDGILDMITPGVGSVASGLLGFLGQQSTNEANIDAASRQEAYGRDMSGTSYQRAVADMKAAGLNPMLAYSQGGASTPGVSLPTIGNSAAAGTSAASQYLQNQVTTATIDKTKAEADNVRADTALKGGLLTQSTASAGHLDAMRDNIRQDMQMFSDRWNLLRKEVERAGFDVQAAQFGAGIKRSEQGMKAFEAAQFPQRIRVELDNLKAMGDKLRNEARLLNLKLPEAMAESRFWGGPDSKSAVYFRHAPRNLTSAFAGALGAAADDVRNAVGGSSEGFKLRGNSDVFAGGRRR